MRIRECHICFTPINEENPAYFLDHGDNITCGYVHIFDRACAEQIEQKRSCPYCRSNNFYALLIPSPPKAKSFYERYRTSAMGDMALSPALMIGLQRVSSTAFSYIPINGLGKFIGGSTGAAFGGYVSFIASFGAIVDRPFGWSSQESLVNGASMLAGLAATHFALGFNDWGTQMGAVLILTSGIANVVFSRLKQSSSG